MKKTILALGGALLLVTACRSDRHSEIVQESFIHKFGVPISKSDWVRNGHDGQIVQLLTSGVTVKRTYEKGVLNGQTSYTFPNSSTIATVETYENGKLVNKVENYPSGISKVEECFNDNKLVQHTQWYEDGTPALIERYEGGFLTSAEYRSPLNVVESRVEEGMGTRLTRSEDGALAYRDTIRAGQMVERITFFANGEPSIVTPYENGLIHGTRLTFISGGVPSSVESWVHGKQEGITVVFTNGEKVAEIPYVKGEKNGIELRFRDGSTLAEEVTWRNGVQHGPRKILVDGTEAKTEWYHQGEIVSRSAFERLNLPAKVPAR